MSLADDFERVFGSEPYDPLDDSDWEYPTDPWCELCHKRPAIDVMPEGWWCAYCTPFDQGPEARAARRREQRLLTKLRRTTMAVAISPSPFGSVICETGEQIHDVLLSDAYGPTLCGRRWGDSKGRIGQAARENWPRCSQCKGARARILEAGDEEDIPDP